MKKQILISIAFISLIISCQFEKKQSGFEDFDMVWSTVDKHYPFLEFKNIEWELVKKEYRTKFERITRQERIELLTNLLNELEDAHVNLFDENDNFLSFYKMPRFIKDELLFDYSVAKQYFKSGISQVNRMYDYGVVNPNIGYIYIHNFPGDRSLYSKINFILDSLKNTKGLILDLRHSGGGRSKASDYIFKRLIPDSIGGVVWTRENGENYPIVNYTPSGINYQNPIIVLINGLSYSVPENLANLCKKVENITVVGDTTGGGGGIPRSFELPSGLKFRISTRTMLRYDSAQVEWNGIPPDILIQNTVAELKSGKDNQLEYAINRLK